MKNNAEKYFGASAKDIGVAIQSGDLDAVEFTELLLDRINKQTSNIFLNVTEKRALNEAKQASKRAKNSCSLSALDGVPIAYKDLLDMAGERTTAASELRRVCPEAKIDAYVVQKATQAGMVNLGKLNLTEFAYSGLGLNPHFGTPHNPHSSQIPYAPGGSSSGSGVAVAAGLAPIAVGTDTGGSIRIPAAFNGVVGYKPSEGRIDKTGIFALSTTFDTVGPLAKTVQDCILFDGILSRANKNRLLRTRLNDISLFIPEGIVFEELEQSVADNFEIAISKLSQAGVKITRGQCPEFSESARLAGELGTITAVEAYVEHKDLLLSEKRQNIDRRVVKRIEMGKAMSASDAISLQRARQKLTQSLTERLNGSLIAMPTTPITAPTIALLESNDDLFHSINLKTLRNTAIGSFLNTPGVAIPNGVDKNGMPTSILISAVANSDELLLSAASLIEDEIKLDRF
jgi:aspartyl-tRNA(Asn)/glutamyl-tRNA(Gln) amidotransferase subunit A